MANENIKSAVKKKGCAVVTVQGKLDAGTAPKFNEYLKGLLGKGEAKIVLDLGAVQYMASSGIGVLVAVKQMALKQNGDLRLCQVPESIQKVLDLLGYSKAFHISASVDEALADF